ncbi:hypothetical protein M5689_020660 [Euphorbia peplus]|nr:hypothetical protein M5689_020660 [Euphorbia peplus]
MLQVGCGVAGMSFNVNDQQDNDSHNEDADRPSEEAARFYRLLEDYKEPLVVDGLKIISARNSKNRNSENWNKHTTGNLSFPELEHLMTQQNGGVLPPANVVWLAEHTHTNDQGVLEWVDDDGRSKEIHDKEPDGDEARPQTQEKMLRHVLGSRSGYTSGKGNGYRGSAKAMLQQEQQRQQQDQILNLKSELEGSQNQIANLQSELQANKKQMEDMEKRIMDMIKRNSRVQSHQDNDDDSDHE